MFYFDWTPERTEQLRTLLASGKSAGAAAAELGVTRNMAMGKASRMHFPMNAPNDGGVRAKTGSAKPRNHHFNPMQAMRKPKAPLKPRPVQRPADAAPSLNLTLLEICDNDCHFIEGDDHLYCGNPAEELRAYCPGHMRIMYQPVRARTA